MSRPGRRELHRQARGRAHPRPVGLLKQVTDGSDGGLVSNGGINIHRVGPWRAHWRTAVRGELVTPPGRPRRRGPLTGERGRSPPSPPCEGGGLRLYCLTEVPQPWFLNFAL